MQKLETAISTGLRFLYKHSSTILSVGAGACTVGAVVSTANAASKTMDYVHEKRIKEMLDISDRTIAQGRNPDIHKIVEITTNDQYKLSTRESIKLWAFPVIFTIGSLVCVIFNHKINAEKQAALIAAAASTAGMFNAYRNATIKEYGKEADDKIMADIAKSEPRYFNLMDEFAHWDVKPDEVITFYDENVGGYFEITPNRYLIAIVHFYREIFTRGYITMTKFYEFLGLKPDHKHKNYCDYYGYDISNICDAMNSEWMDWYVEPKTLDDGMVIYEMYADFDPVDLTVEWL